jgi:hypothetical protein
MQTLEYPIRVPSDVLEALGEFTGQHWNDGLAMEPFICEAIRNYMQPVPAAQAQSASTDAAAAAGEGYQWKQLYLPAGTRLRASFGGHNYFARVEGEEIRYGEHAMSPSRFANLQGSGNRNAWKAVWLCFPGSEEWLPADVCRSARKAAIARLLGAGAEAERPPQMRERRLAERRTARITADRKRIADPRASEVRANSTNNANSADSAEAYAKAPCENARPANRSPISWWVAASGWSSSGSGRRALSAAP